MPENKETFFMRFMGMGYWADFYIYPLMALILIAFSFAYFYTPVWQIVLYLAIGFCIWGITEYFMHRYAFHHAPIFKQGHTEHHQRPKDHIGTPFFVTIPIYLFVSWLIALGLGYAMTCALLAGFVSGYYCYLITHHVVHNKKIKPGTFWHRYKKFHDTHHYKQDVNFGVSWMVWDKIFRTHQK
jgi:sterol desaturase/sphingolipid hydroxylase (fatty acid hydroxylase superfamily)